MWKLEGSQHSKGHRVAMAPLEVSVVLVLGSSAVSMWRSSHIKGLRCVARPPTNPTVLAILLHDV